MSAAIQNEQHAAVEGGHRPRDHDTSHPDGRAATHATATPAGENASGSQAAEEPFDRQEYVIRLLTGGGGNFRDLPSVEILEDLKEEYEPVVVEGDDEFSLEAARAKEEEVWVLKLPFTMPYQCLEGCTLHLPCELPEPRHLHPPKDLLSGRYDLLAYVKAATKPTHIGHLELAPDVAFGHGQHAYRELHQESEHVAARLRCAGTTHDEEHETLPTVKVARVINVSEDVLTLNRQSLAMALFEGQQDWGDKNGWDGQLPPRKRRKRVAGWELIGKNPNDGDVSSEDFDDPFGDAFSSSSSEEEFDEVVFLPEKEQPILKEEVERQQQEAEGRDEAEAAAEMQQQLMESLAEDVKDPVDWDERWYEGDHWDPLSYYHQQQKQPGPSTQPEMDEEDPDLDLYEFFMSLPVRPEVAEQQQAYEERLAAQAWQQQRREQGLQQAPEQQADWQHDEEQQEGWQQQGWQPGEGQQTEWQPEQGQPENFQTPSRQQQHTVSDSDVVIVDDDGYSPHTPSSAGDAAPHEHQAEPVDDLPVSFNTGNWGHDNEAAGDREQQTTQPDAENQAQGTEKQKKEERPPRTVAEMLEPLYYEHDFILQMPTYIWQLRMRNMMVKELLSYEELCQQVDLDAMNDVDVYILLQLLLEYKRHLDGADFDDTEPDRLQVAQLLVPSEGLSPRPCLKQVEEGYAPYQVDDEGRETVVIPPPSPDWQTTDQHLAERMIKQGAGRLHRFVTTEELRSKGFEWDSDPEEDKREGLSITLPDGTSMHVPSGLHLPTS